MEYYSYLTPEQIKLLETIKPLSQWRFELNCYFEDDNFDCIDETFWQNQKTITFNDFYYAGVDMTIIHNDNTQKCKQLKILINTIYSTIRNPHYHDIAIRLYTDYKIGKQDYDNVYNALNNIITLP